MIEAAASFLGSGWRFPVGPDERGGIAISRGPASIEESILIIIGTVPGERVHRPEFGCRVGELVFAPNHARTRDLACRHVVEALVRWEPRVADVRCEADPAAPHEILLRVSYVIRATNHPGSLVHPFHLRAAPGGTP